MKTLRTQNEVKDLNPELKPGWISHAPSRGTLPLDHYFPNDSTQSLCKRVLRKLDVEPRADTTDATCCARCKQRLGAPSLLKEGKSTTNAKR